jgi:N-acetylglutamate synthase-like GNAT family acetyltransferase
MYDLRFISSAQALRLGPAAGLPENMMGIRPAREAESVEIRDLIRLVGINPMGLDWKRFVVAVDERDQMIGCGQIKPHKPDTLELASIAVRPEHRGRGIARLIIEHLVNESPRPLYLMCESSLGPLYEKFGFRAILPAEMPRYFQRISKLAGLVTTLARRQERLLVMKLQ